MGPSKDARYKKGCPNQDIVDILLVTGVTTPNVAGVPSTSVSLNEGTLRVRAQRQPQRVQGGRL
jgi:hypothetical protein